MNETGEERFATEEDKRAWGLLWNQESKVFNTFVDYDLNLAYLENCMFLVLRWKSSFAFLDRIHLTSTKL
jgi:hypothetical protein